MPQNMTKTEPKTTTSLNIRSMPKSLHRKFKAWCAMRGLTMEEAAIRILESEVSGLKVPAK